MFLLSLCKETVIVTSAQPGLSLFWSETPVFEPRSRRNLLNRKWGFIAYSLSLSPVHCPDMTKILLKGTRKRKLSIILVRNRIVFPPAPFSMAPRHAPFSQRHALFPSAMPFSSSALPFFRRHVLFQPKAYCSPKLLPAN